MAVAVAVAVARTTLVTRLRTVSQRIHRVAGALLVAAGLYVVRYWVFTLTVPPGSADALAWARVVEVPVRAVERLSSWSVNAVQGRAALMAAVLGAMVAAAAIAASGTGRLRRPAPSTPRPD